MCSSDLFPSHDISPLSPILLHSAVLFPSPIMDTGKGFAGRLLFFPFRQYAVHPSPSLLIVLFRPHCHCSRIMSSSPFSDAFPADSTRRFLCLPCSWCIFLSDAGHIAVVVVGLASPLVTVSKKYFPCKCLIVNKLQTLTKNIYPYLLTKRKHCITFVSSNAEAIPQTFTTHHHHHATARQNKKRAYALPCSHTFIPDMGTPRGRYQKGL